MVLQNNQLNIFIKNAVQLTAFLIEGILISF